MISLTDILVPVDFSEPSWRATQYALALAEPFGARVHLLHVIEDPVVYLPVFEGYPYPAKDQLETYAQDRLENWIPDENQSGLEVACHWRHGNPSRMIVSAAQELRIGLIVVGTHGRGGAMHLLLGSVAESVVRHAPCPVLTVLPSTREPAI